MLGQHGFAFNKIEIISNINQKFHLKHIFSVRKHLQLFIILIAVPRTWLHIINMHDLLSNIHITNFNDKYT